MTDAPAGPLHNMPLKKGALVRKRPVKATPKRITATGAALKAQAEKYKTNPLLPRGVL